MRHCASACSQICVCVCRQVSSQLLAAERRREQEEQAKSRLLLQVSLSSLLAHAFVHVDKHALDPGVHARVCNAGGEQGPRAAERVGRLERLSEPMQGEAC